MTIRITETSINYSWLNKNINEETKYLIMNRETLSLMQKDHDVIKGEIKSSNFVPRYRDRPIATCDELEFGAVEIV